MKKGQHLRYPYCSQFFCSILICPEASNNLIVGNEEKSPVTMTWCEAGLG